MSLTLDQLREKHIALPGDVMLCPECRAPLLRFTTHTWKDSLTLPAGRAVRTGEHRFTLWCRACGAGATRAKAGPGTKGIEDAEHASMLVQSGTWTGWRALSGE